MRLLIAVSVIALAACQKDPPEAAQPTPEELGQDDPNIPFTPAPVGPSQTFEATSKTAMSFTPGVLTFTPTPQKSENLPSGVTFAFGNGIILETTLDSAGAVSGPNPPDWTKIFSDPAGPIDPEKVTLYSVDREVVPPGTPNGGLCTRTQFVATYTMKSPGAEDLVIAAFDSDIWPPASEAALCGTFMYSNMH